MIGIRPPEYWPRLRYLGLILSVDHFILADTFQYSRQSFQNRTQLRTPQGWQWITVPLKGGQHGKPIRNVDIEWREYWPRKHWRSLEFNYHSAPFFEFYEPELSGLLKTDWSTLGDLTCATVETLCRLIGITTPVSRASSLSGAPSNISAIMTLTGNQDLLVPQETFLHDSAIIERTIPFTFIEPVRRQNFEGFEPDMSALDLLLTHGPDARRTIEKIISRPE